VGGDAGLFSKRFWAFPAANETTTNAKLKTKFEREATPLKRLLLFISSLFLFPQSAYEYGVFDSKTPVSVYRSLPNLSGSVIYSARLNLIDT
jgi:hypothetical protein